MSRVHKKALRARRGNHAYPAGYPVPGNRDAALPARLVEDRSSSASTERGSRLPEWLWNRRTLNIMAALVLIIAALPLMILIAALIKLTSRGPILYTQPRVGVDRRRDARDLPIDPRRQRDLGGRIFRIYKFRTMVHDSDNSRPQRWASRDDPRVTRIGAILRRFRIDELPQLFNVLKGDMNLVGPRPEQPEIFQQLRDEVEGYQRRQRVLPGITGLAQVNLHYDQCLEDVRRKVMLDLDYVDRTSPIEDVRIMARTVPVVLFGKGAQ